jgi:hypothetical protein
LGVHYASADHVKWWREQIKKHGSLDAVYNQIHIERQKLQREMIKKGARQA